PMHGQSAGRPILRSPRRQLEDDLAHLRGGDGRRLGGAEANRHRVCARLWPLPEQPAVLVGEYTAPELVEVGGDDRPRRGPGNSLETALEWQHDAVSGWIAFGKYADHLAILKCRVDSVE